MTHSTQQPPLEASAPPYGWIAIEEIEYLLAVGRIPHIMLGGVAMVSLDGLRDYLRRHENTHDQAAIDLQPALA